MPALRLSFKRPPLALLDFGRQCITVLGKCTGAIFSVLVDRWEGKGSVVHSTYAMHITFIPYLQVHFLFKNLVRPLRKFDKKKTHPN